MIIKSNKKFIWEAENDYTLSRSQARRIFLGKAKTFQCECWKRVEGWTINGCDQSIRAVSRNNDGTITIGCTIIAKAEITKAKRWLRRKA